MTRSKVNEFSVELPGRRIKPVDGMAVTAGVWEEAHAYHRLHRRFHDRALHGPGIVVGLEVVASDPPDASVYVLPGVAVDPLGRLIVVPEPVAFDFGSAHGQLRLLLIYDEGRPAPEADEEEGPLYVRAQFGIEVGADLSPGAVRPIGSSPARGGDSTPPPRVEKGAGGSDGVELARVWRRDREAAVRDAGDAEHPGQNAIDLRFRRGVGVVAQPVARLAVFYTGGLKVLPRDTLGRGGHGADHLARWLRSTGRQAWVDDAVSLHTGLDGVDLLYVVGRDAFQLDREEMAGLYAYLQSGGTVFFESCRCDARDATADMPADASFLDLLASMGVHLQELAADHPLLNEPNLFAAPPPGFETGGAPRVLAAEGVVFASGDYGCLWQGNRRDRVATREEIRSAAEWGANLVAYALDRACLGQRDNG